MEQELGLLSYGALADAERDIEHWASCGYRVLPFTSGEYPDNLRVVENRPPLLFVEGALVPSDRRAVSVIGTRLPTEYGREQARAVAEVLAHADYAVVSGLAAGIDAEAHRAVLDLQTDGLRCARTLAVLGTGLGRVYPPEHERLQEEIAERGALISQLWPGEAGSRSSFPARNALMSGLTLGSVIVEAGERSGTRVQARHALAQGRRVVLMPPMMRCAWAIELAERPEVVVAEDVMDVVAAFRP